MSLSLSLSLSLGLQGGGGAALRAPLLTVACGNSISAQSKWTGSRYSPTGDLHIANLIAGSPMRFGRITPSTRTDLNGVYGYSGQTLATINGDIAAQWIATVNAGSIVPELVVGLALLENDIVGGADVATMQSRLATWIATVQAAWPSAKILLGTPRPATNYNTGGMVAAYQGIRDHILSLDNGSTIFVTRMDGYEDPGDPGHPLSGFTSDGLHPSPKGAMVTGRALGATVRRIITPALGTVLGTNTLLTGSVAATGTGISGTKPSGMFHTGDARLTCVSTAQQPGWRTNITLNSGSLSCTFLNFTPAQSIAGSPPLILPYAKVQLVSGASNLLFLGLDPRITDGGGNNFQYALQNTTPDNTNPADYVDGDVLTFVVPPKAPGSGSITALSNYFSPTLKALGTPVVFDIIEQGYLLP